MEINLTLLAQIIHFFLAWLIIQKLLLEPALQSILEEQDADQRKKSAIDLLKKEYDQKNHYKQAQWKECQRQFAVGVPADINRLHLLYAAQTPKEMLSKDRETPIKSQEVKEMAQVITKQIEHIDD